MSQRVYQSRAALFYYAFRKNALLELGQFNLGRNIFVVNKKVTGLVITFASFVTLQLVFIPTAVKVKVKFWFSAPSAGMGSQK